MPWESGGGVGGREVGGREREPESTCERGHFQGSRKGFILEERAFDVSLKEQVVFGQITR